MAWTTPATFTTGNVLTAAQLNTNLRDNSTYLFDQPMALVSKSGTTAIVTATAAADFVFNNTVYSSPGITVTLATTSFLPTFAGTYQAWLNITWAGSAAGARIIAIYEQVTAQILAAQSLPTVATGHAISMTCSGAGPLIVNGSTHNIRAQVYQDSGINQNVLGTATNHTDLVAPGNVPLGDPCYFGIKMLGTGS